MRTDRLSFDARAVFERVALALVGLGVAAGTVAVAGGARFVQAPALMFGVTTAALLSASTLRGRDDTLGLPTRALLFAGGLAVGLAFDSALAGVFALGAFAGLAMAGASSMARRAVGFAAGLAGTGWAIAVLPRLDAIGSAWPLPVRAVALGSAGGVLFGAALLALHVRVHADAVAAQLTDERLQKLWARCHQALAPARPGLRAEVLRLLGRNVGDAAKQTQTLAALDARLRAADRKDAEDQLAQLKADAAAATDATARQRLISATASLGDSLEALDSLDRKRERLQADLRLSLATLERAAMALETAQGEPDEVRAVTLRLLEREAAA